MKTPATSSQTVGPYFSIGLSYQNGTEACSAETPGEHVEISGQLFDGDGVPVPDAQLEIWQADASGRFAGVDATGAGSAPVGFAGFVRMATDERGGFCFRTVVPGSVADPAGGGQAPHIAVVLFMRGLLRHLYTRIYFEGIAQNQSDRVLLAVPEERRNTLIARAEGVGRYVWNIHMQGDNETVFFEY
jgi:protocatechuate 3,4-dioxygenase alpha subunit